MVARIEARDLRASVLDQELHVIRAEHGVGCPVDEQKRSGGAVQPALGLPAISAVYVNCTGSRSGGADDCYRCNIYLSKQFIAR
jgi:hypothetical protein